jgi:hypothetical protein
MICPHCQSLLPDRTYYCKRCGRNIDEAYVKAALEQPATTAPAAVTESAADTKKCPFCAEDIKAAAVVCKHCGRTLASGASEVQIVAAPKKKGSGWGLLGLIALLVVFMAWCASRPPSGDGPVAAKNPTHDALMEKRDFDRREYLKQAVVGVGDECGTAVAAYHQGMAKDGTSIWNLRCGAGREYAITIPGAAGGTVKVLDCKVMKSVGGPPCFTQLGQ